MSTRMCFNRKGMLGLGDFVSKDLLANVCNVGSYERGGSQSPRGFDQFLWWYLGRYLGSLAIFEVGVSFIINRIGCIMAALMFVNHPLLSV